MTASDPIGFFDSGLGGISVLRACRSLLPAEDFLYFGDSANAPYGTKTPEQVLALSRSALDRLLSLNAKAIVIACNTATGIAVDTLRKDHPELPIIGVEPAVKPAALKYTGQRVLVLATPGCHQSARVQELLRRHSRDAELIAVPCEGLMEFVERGEFSGETLQHYLVEKLTPYCERPVRAAVLGCTHYPFLRNAISSVLGPEVDILDGNLGIARQLERRLAETSLLNDRGGGKVTFFNSSNDPSLLERSLLLLNRPE